MTSISNISMAWNVTTQPQWDDFMCQADRSPLEQSWAYGDAMASCYGQTIDRVVIQHGKRVLAVMQVFHKRLFGFASVIRIVRGPLFLDDTPEALRFDVYRAVRRIFSFRCWKVPLWLPNALDEPEVHFMTQRGSRRRWPPRPTSDGLRRHRAGRGTRRRSRSGPGGRSTTASPG